MDLNQYQELARSTAIYPTEHRIVYPALGLAGEAGEVAEKIKKMLRDGTPEEDVQVALAKELGDVLWYIANMASDMGLSLSDIAEINVQKLANREKKGLLHGSGDDRGEPENQLSELQKKLSKDRANLTGLGDSE